MQGVRWENAILSPSALVPPVSRFGQITELDDVRERDRVPVGCDPLAVFFAELCWQDGATQPDDNHSGLIHVEKCAVQEMDSEWTK